MSLTKLDKSFKSNIYFSYGTQVLGFAIAFANVTLITNVGGVKLYGLIAILTALSSILSNLVSFRTNEAVIKFYKRGLLEGNNSIQKFALISGLSVDLTIATILYSIIYILSGDISTSLLKNNELDKLVQMYGFIIVITFIRGMALGYFSAVEKFKIINFLVMLEHLTRLIVLLIYYHIQNTINLEILIKTQLFAASLVTALLLLEPIKKLIIDFRFVKMNDLPYKEYLKFSTSTFLSSTIKAGNQNVDTLILGYLTSPALVGIYSLFKQVLTPNHMLAQPFTSQIYPKFVALCTQNKCANIQTLINDSSKVLRKWFLILLAFIFPLFFVYAHANNIEISTNVIYAFVFACINSYVVQQLWWARPFSLATDPNISLKANIIALCIMPVTVAILTYGYGIIGTTLGVLISNIVINKYYKSKLNTTCRKN